MRFFRKQSSGSGADRDPASKLRAEIGELEKERARSTQTLADLEAEAHAIQGRAIDAIRSGDDRAARSYVLELQPLTEKMEMLKADLTVLRATLDECYEFVSRAAPR